MSILDLAEDDTVETLIKGAGYSVMYEPSLGRARYDAWGGDVHRAVPFMGLTKDDVLTGDRPRAAIQKLRGDAEREPIISLGVEALADRLGIA